MWLGVALLGAGWMQEAQAAPRLLEDFDAARGLRLQVSEGASGQLQPVAGSGGGRAQCLQLDFGAHAGSARLVIERPLQLPPHARFELAARGQAAQAQLAIEVVSADGRRYGSHQPGRVLGDKWQPLRWDLDDFTDAEGRALPLPLQARELRLIAASAEGGALSWCVDQLRLHPDPPDDAPLAATALADTATALQQRMVDGRSDTFWISSGVKQQTVSLDLGRPREIGGLVVQWGAGLRADRYRVQGSLDGRRWQALRRVDGASGTVDRLRLGPLSARYLRLDLESGPNWRYGIVELAPQPAAFGRSTLAWLGQIGRHLADGVLPASITSLPQQWTVLAAGDAPAPAWFGSTGIVEPLPGRYTIEPQLQVDGNWYSGQDMDAIPQPGQGGAHTLLQHAQARLEVEAVPGSDSAGQGWLQLRYRLRNSDRHEHRYALALAVRPFQLNPAGRYGDIGGGPGWIGEIAVDGARVVADGRLALLAAQAPEAAFASHVDAGLELALLRAAQWPQQATARDSQGLASAVMVWRRTLAAGDSAEWLAWVPLSTAAGAQTTAPAGFRPRPPALAGLVLPGENGQRLASAWVAAVTRMRDERNGPWLRADSRRQVGAGNRDGMAIAAALVQADQGDAVVPWLLARVRAGSTGRCETLRHWAALAATLQLAGSWPDAALDALQPWLVQAQARLGPGAACAAGQEADPAQAQLSLLLPAPAVAAPADSVAAAAQDAAAPAADPEAAVAGSGQGLEAPAADVVVPVPGTPIGNEGRQQRWQAALAAVDGGLPAGWQRWARGQVSGLVDARQAAAQVQAIAALLAEPRDAHLLLLPGLPAEAWGGRLAVPGLLTPWGRLGLQARREGRDWVLDIAPGLQLPPDGLVLEWPYTQPPGAVTVDGAAAAWQDGRLHLRQLPRQLRISLPAGH